METLQRLTRRQVEALRSIGATGRSARGVPLKSTAEALGIRPPTALDLLDRLEELRLIRRVRGKSQLTRQGSACLAEYLRHHRVVETMLSKAGVPAEAVCDAAHEVDLFLSHRTIQRICEGEGHPRHCPHGEPIPPCSTGP